MKPFTRVLLVDDNARIRAWLSTSIERIPNLKVVGEASDGAEAIEKAKDLRPDLVLLDIGLPRLNGIEVTRFIRNVSPESKILIVSEHRSQYIVSEALRSGATGYLVKSDAGSGIQSAVESVLLGRQFISKSVEEGNWDQRAHDPVPQRIEHKENIPARSHDACFYSDDQRLMEDVVPFIGGALRAGDAAVVLATESHREDLLRRLKVWDQDLKTAIKRGRYTALDAATIVSKVLVNGRLDVARFTSMFGACIAGARAKSEKHNSRVAVFGECAPLLLKRGHPEAAIQLERVANDLVRESEIDILCGYSLHDMQETADGLIYQQICAEHSCIFSR